MQNATIRTMPARALVLAAAATMGWTGWAGSAAAQPTEDLGRYFGFEPARIIVVDEDCGPVVVADFNGDSRPDVAVANNRKSRVEVHYLRAEARTDQEAERGAKANELPPNPWYDKTDLSVPHRVTAMRAHDVDGDGKLDLVYVGANPAELVVFRQESPQKFEVWRKKRVQSLAARQGGLVIADVSGDAAPEVVTIADGKANVLSMSADGTMGDPVVLGSATNLAAVFVEDYNGDGLTDILGAIPEDAAPLRVWLQRQDPRTSAKAGLLGAELRFEMPQLSEAEPVRFPGRKAASISVIERASRRIVFSDLAAKPIEAAAPGTKAEREVRAEVTGFSDGATKERSVAVADIDGDGMQDLLATDAKANTVVLYRQAPGIGLAQGEPFSAFKKPKTVAVGHWGPKDAAGAAAAHTPEVFVLSEEEKTVGVSRFDRETGRLGFPAPVNAKTPGAAPVAMGFVELNGVGTLAVVLKDKRDHTLELHVPTGSEGEATTVTVVPLTGVTRPPQSMLAADADQDGKTDILLFTPSEPMVMVRNTGDADPAKSWKVLTDREMPQFGLVQAAGPENTALLDFNGNGSPDLVIADENFVRACAYDAAKGWRVVEQVTVPDLGTKFVGVASATVGGSANGTGGTPWIVVSDRGNGRLLAITRGEATAGGEGGGGWAVADRMRLRGFPLGPVFAGRFGGEAASAGDAGSVPGVLCVSEDGFGLVRLSGERMELEEFAAFRSDAKDRVEHEIEVGDLNGDGFVDAAVLDAGEQMCSILTFSNSRKALLATEFEVFQSRLFSRGAGREFEPRSANVDDVTGDGKDDLILTVHDRLIIYPQAAK